MKIHRVIIFLTLMTSYLWGELPQFFLGPTIQSVDANEDTTALEVINQIRTAISKDKESKIALRIEPCLIRILANGKANMQVKNIPALIVIKYVADQ